MRKSKPTNGGLTCGMRGQVLLTQALPTGFGRRKKKEKKEEKVFRERVSNFSLNFLMIGPSNPGEPRGKVDPHCKSYPWVPFLWSFDNSGW